MHDFKAYSTTIGFLIVFRTLDAFETPLQHSADLSFPE
jgi:hypothetical protein